MVDTAAGPSAPLVINTREWYDHQFDVAWERNNGPAQTRYFMTRLVAELPPKVRATIGESRMSILDWGCAFGDGVDALSHAFPACTIAGQDFSIVAITRARARYPNLTFICAADISETFDVIVTSNCLEHYDRPLDLVRSLLLSCRRIFIALVPLEERPLMEGHKFSFDLGSFPRRLGMWSLLVAKKIDVDPKFWCGHQLMAVYVQQESRLPRWAAIIARLWRRLFGPPIRPNSTRGLALEWWATARAALRIPKCTSGALPDPCVYRKPKPADCGDGVRQGSRGI
jgi:SAM-dependent methyltransferase